MHVVCSPVPAVLCISCALDQPGFCTLQPHTHVLKVHWCDDAKSLISLMCLLHLRLHLFPGLSKAMHCNRAVFAFHLQGWSA